MARNQVQYAPALRHDLPGHSASKEHSKPRLVGRSSTEQRGNLPLEVMRLPWREREVAEIIYRDLALIPSEIELEVSGTIGNGAIRTILKRLMTKGIVRRMPSGYGKTFLYLPALATVQVEELAFKRIARDFYRNRPDDAVMSMAPFMDRLFEDAKYAERELAISRAVWS